MEKVRIAWIDLSKVVCIWLMVCCHAGQKGLILDITYQFHMPAFFIISGFLFRPKGFRTTIKSFGIPIITFGTLNLLHRLAFGIYKAHDMRVISSIISSWFKNILFFSDISVFQGYWFVLTLMLMRLLMEVDCVRRSKYWIALASILWCCLEPLIDFPVIVTGFKPYHVISCLPFFITGMVIKEKKIDVMDGSFELKLIGFALFFILTLIQGRVDLVEYDYGRNYIILFVNALLGSWLLFNICRLAPQRSWVQTLGTGTFLILGLHGMMYGYIQTALYRALGLFSPYLPLLVGLIVLVVCYLPIAWCEKMCPSLLGKINIKNK